MRRLLIAAALALSSLFAVTAPAMAAEFSRYNDDGVMLIEGPILEGDADRLSVFLAEDHSYEIVLLNSPGGLVSEGAMIAALVRAFGLKTGVATDDECVSICMLVFSAGVERWVLEGAHLGVHSASDENAVETEGTMAVTLAIGRQMVAYGASPDIIGLMAVARGQEVTWLGRADLEGWVNIAEPSAPSE